MKQIQNAILKMDTDLTSEEFSTLCHALYEMRASFPDPPMMKVICSDIKVKAKKLLPPLFLKVWSALSTVFLSTATARSWPPINAAGFLSSLLPTSLSALSPCTYITI